MESISAKADFELDDLLFKHSEGYNFRGLDEEQAIAAKAPRLIQHLSKNKLDAWLSALRPAKLARSPIRAKQMRVCDFETSIWPIHHCST